MSEAQQRRQEQAPVTHGVHSFEKRGEAALVPAEVASLQELRELVAYPEGREQVRQEVTARLVIICRKVFGDMEASLADPQWWEAGVVRRGGTYLAELRRWLDTFQPSQDPPMSPAEAVAAAMKEVEGE